MPNVSSEALIREYSIPVAATTMWEIRANSVGSGRQAAAKSPAHQGSVGSPLWGIDRTQGFVSTKLQDKTVPRQGMLGLRGPDGWIGSADGRSPWQILQTTV